MKKHEYDQGDVLIKEFWRAWNNFISGIVETLTREDFEDIKRRRREREELRKKGFSEEEIYELTCSDAKKKGSQKRRGSPRSTGRHE